LNSIFGLRNFDYIVSSLNVNDLAITVVAMILKLAISEELHPTFQTLSDFHVHVSPLVCFFIAVRDESLVAIWAFVFLFTCVDLHVRYQAVFKFELLTTHFIWTLITIIMAEKIKSVYAFVVIRSVFFILNTTLNPVYRFWRSLPLCIPFSLVLIFLLLRSMHWNLIKNIVYLSNILLGHINLKGWSWLIITWCTWFFSFVRFGMRTWRSSHIDLLKVLIGLEDNWLFSMTICVVRFLIDQFFLDDIVESHLPVFIIKRPDHIWWL